MSGKIPAERLAADKTVIVKGKTSFSRLAQHITGQKLADSVARAKAAGRLYPTDRPHTTISVVDAEVQFADPANPTLEEQFVAQQLFTYQKGENAGRVGYSIDDTSPFLPLILVPDEENPGAYRQQVLENELASGLAVRIVLGTFKSKAGYQKTGIGIQQVVLDEAPRYYTQGVNTDELAARGIVVSGGITRVSAEDAAKTASAPAQGEYVGTDENGFPTAGPVAQPAAPVQQPVAQAPVQQPVAQQAPAPAAPAPAPVAQPQAQEETPEQKIARLQAQLDAARGSGQAEGTSAFDQGQAPTQNPGPWD